MTDERALEIELALRRAAMDGPPDDRQRLVGLALEVLTGWRRARDLATAANKPVTHTRGPKGRFASPAVVGGSTCEGSP